MVHHFTSIYVKCDIVACPKINGCVFLRKKSPCGRHIDHGVVGGTRKSIKINNTTHEIHAPKFQGRVFPGKKKPLREEHRPRGGGRSPQMDEHTNYCQSSCSIFLKKHVDVLKMSNLKYWNVSGNSFHVFKNPYMEKITKNMSNVWAK